jgi:hypothetical protein
VGEANIDPNVLTRESSSSAEKFREVLTGGDGLAEAGVVGGMGVAVRVGVGTCGADAGCAGGGVFALADEIEEKENSPVPGEVPNENPEEDADEGEGEVNLNPVKPDEAATGAGSAGFGAPPVAKFAVNEENEGMADLEGSGELAGGTVFVAAVGAGWVSFFSEGGKLKLGKETFGATVASTLGAAVTSGLVSFGLPSVMVDVERLVLS